MSFPKPFHRNYRPLVKRSNSGYNSWVYLTDHDYAINPHHYTRAFLMIQNDIISLFEYIEPSDLNLKTYSFKIYELLVKTCIEIEANFKAILRENFYEPKKKTGEVRNKSMWNINDFKKVNITHHLDDFEIIFPYWRGEQNKVKPFANWKTNLPLTWYQSYNSAKHNRDLNFEHANFENLLSAFCGLFALISSQFGKYSYSTGPSMLSTGSESYFKGQTGIGSYLRIDFPRNWLDNELYDFEWEKLKNEEEKFKKYNYN